MKKVVRIAAFIVLAIVILMGLFQFRYRRMATRITSEHAKVTAVNLNQVDDGVYEGSFSEFLVSITVKVTVKDHRITDITVVKQFSGKGYEATETIPRILEAQSPQVDAVAGATGSSKGIMIAVYRALTQR